MRGIMSTLAEDHPTAKLGQGRALVMRFHVSEVEDHAMIIGQACILKTPSPGPERTLESRQGCKSGKLHVQGLCCPWGVQVSLRHFRAA